MTAPPHTRLRFAAFTVVAAASAALAAWSAAALTLEVWVMFTGFIAWFTRPTALRHSLAAMLCLWLGIALAALAHRATGALAPGLGAAALPLVVFAAGCVIVGLRATRALDNMLAWFVGMVTFFAAGLGASPEAFAHLGAATAIGALAGWSCQTVNRRWVEA